MVTFWPRIFISISSHSIFCRELLYNSSHWFVLQFKSLNAINVWLLNCFNSSQFCVIWVNFSVWDHIFLSFFSLFSVRPQAGIDYLCESQELFMKNIFFLSCSQAKTKWLDSFFKKRSKILNFCRIWFLFISM